MTFATIGSMSSRSRSPFPGSSQRRGLYNVVFEGLADNDNLCPITTGFAAGFAAECPPQMAVAPSLPDSQPAAPHNIDIASDDGRDPCPSPCSPTLSDTSENVAAWLAPKCEVLETPKPPVDTPEQYRKNRLDRLKALAIGWLDKPAELCEQQPAAPSGEQQPAAQSSDAAYPTWREHLEGERAADQAAALAPSESPCQTPRRKRANG